MNSFNCTEPPPPRSPHRNDNKTKTSITGDDSDLSPSRGAHIKKKQNTQGTPTQQQQQQHINHQQHLLMLLCHAAKCPYTDNQCPLSSQCWQMKLVWKHIQSGCKELKCTYPFCRSARFLLSHYSKCKRSNNIQTCMVCGPAQEGINERRCCGQMVLTDLPNITLVASYLPKISRVLLAIALSSGNNGHDSTTSKAILSAPEQEDEQYWETLDFEELERNLTMKLNDEHISTILKYTDAKNKLKSIKMTGCTSILGHGLEHIRTSTVINRIDLVLVKPTAEDQSRDGTKYNDTKLVFKLSEEHILPILHDIISQPGCSLRYLQLPPNWDNGRASEAVGDLARRFIRFKKENQDVKCSSSKCRQSCENSNSCYSCLREFCELSCPYQSSWSYLEQEDNYDSCPCCRRRYCRRCAKTKMFSCKICENDGTLGDKRCCEECSTLMKGKQRLECRRKKDKGICLRCSKQKYMVYW